MATYALKPTDPLWRRLQSVFDALEAAEVQIDHCAGTWIVHDLARKRDAADHGISDRVRGRRIRMQGRRAPSVNFQHCFESMDTK